MVVDEVLCLPAPPVPVPPVLLQLVAAAGAAAPFRPAQLTCAGMLCPPSLSNVGRSVPLRRL